MILYSTKWRTLEQRRLFPRLLHSSDTESGDAQRPICLETSKHPHVHGVGCIPLHSNAFPPFHPVQHAAYDFDLLVAGHLTRLGTKEDVQAEVDYMADILAGAEFALSTVSVADIGMGTGVGDPTNPNFGNTWCVRFIYPVPSRSP